MNSMHASYSLFASPNYWCQILVLFQLVCGAVFLKVGGTASLWALERIRGAVAASSKIGAVSSESIKLLIITITYKEK